MKDKTNAGIIKRAEAYILDILLIGFITTAIYSGLNLIFEFKTTYTDKYQEETKQILNDYQKSVSKDKTSEETKESEEPTEITEETIEEDKTMTAEEYLNKITEVTEKYYTKMFLESVPNKLINFVVGILYFSLLAYYLKGQTLFKKFFNIKVVNKEGKAPSYIQLLLRSVIFTGYYATALELILVFLVKKDFYMISSSLETISATIMLLSIVLAMFNKSGKGLHDLIAGTSVVNDEN